MLLNIYNTILLYYYTTILLYYYITIVLYFYITISADPFSGRACENQKSSLLQSSRVLGANFLKYNRRIVPDRSRSHEIVRMGFPGLRGFPASGGPLWDYLGSILASFRGTLARLGANWGEVSVKIRPKMFSKQIFLKLLMICLPPNLDLVLNTPKIVKKMFQNQPLVK